MSRAGGGHYSISTSTDVVPRSGLSTGKPAIISGITICRDGGIAVVQGSAFGLEGFFRISYATSMENLKKAMDKISIFCKSLN